MISWSTFITNRLTSTDSLGNCRSICDSVDDSIGNWWLTDKSNGSDQMFNDLTFMLNDKLRVELHMGLTYLCIQDTTDYEFLMYRYTSKHR